MLFSAAKQYLRVGGTAVEHQYDSHESAAAVVLIIHVDSNSDHTTLQQYVAIEIFGYLPEWALGSFTGA